MRPLAAVVLLALAAAACPVYEYEEEVFLEVDGAGRFRLSGSTALFPAFHDLSGAMTLDEVRAHFEAPGVELTSVRETRRGGRTFVHVQGRFDDWNDLCGHPAFRHRECRLLGSDESLELRLVVPPARTGRSTGRAPADARIAFRFHFPSSVSYHNSPTGLERGNILRWEREARELGREPFRIEAHFGRRSVLATTLTILVAALAIVVLSVALTLVFLVRKGRRQLEADRSAAGPAGAGEG